MFRRPLITPLLGLALLLVAPVAAAQPQRCQSLRQERDRLAAQAMQQEIALVRRWRQRLCPALAQQAEAANANALAAGGNTLQPAGGSPTVAEASRGGSAASPEQPPTTGTSAFRAPLAPSSTLASPSPLPRPSPLGVSSPLTSLLVSPSDQPFDYTAWLQCRRQAEQRLQAQQSLLYRNRLGFTFYTLSGATAAIRADALDRDLRARACP